MNRSTIYTILILIAFLLSGCGFEGEANIGVYTCYDLELENEQFDTEDIYPNGFRLELSDWGQAWLEIDGERFYGRWSVEGEAFTLDIGGELTCGTISDGLCTLYLPESRLKHSLILEGKEPPAKEIMAEIPAELDERQLFWDGDWYGRWYISNATGVYVDQNGQYFDCFARFTISEDDSGTLLFWDELQSAHEPVAKLSILISDDGDNSASGIVVSDGGYFLDSEINGTQWTLEPGWNGFDSMISVQNGSYEGEKGSFDYNIILRPWGRTWEDVEAQQPQLIPYFYYDWYLPALANSRPMPDEFTPPNENVIRNTWIDPEETEDSE